MASSTIIPNHQFEEDQEIWANLKEAIANSSGFEQWQQEQNLETEPQINSLDSQVRLYLRETLETLAY